MNERQLLTEILTRAERTERRVRNIQFRGIRMERTIDMLKDDMDGLKASVANLVAAATAFKTTVQDQINTAIAADEAGTDVDIVAMKKTVDDAAAQFAASATAATAAVDAAPAA